MRTILNCVIFLLICTSCGKSYKEEQLIGEWEYIKVEYTNQNPVLVQNKDDLKEKYPSIKFHKNKKCQIFSAGKVISEGEFFLEKDIIRYEEVLQVGIKRKIPFIIKKLENDELIFETLERDVKRITSKRKN